MYSEIMPK